LRSLREHQLDAVRHGRTAHRLAARPGRLKREELIASEDALREAGRARDLFAEAQRELRRLGVFCPDANRGVALVPFIHDQRLAWYVVDLFDPEALSFWRFHEDPEDTRRPIMLANGGPTPATRVA
jgi:hypothetical protein